MTPLNRWQPREGRDPGNATRRESQEGTLMIAKITRYGGNTAGLIRHLYHAGPPGDAQDPHMIAGWPAPAELEPPRRRDDRQDVKRLIGLLEQTTAARGGSGSARPVWHCVMRAAPEDRPPSDGAWAQIASDVMDRTGLSRYEEEDPGVRWVAIRSGADRIHIVAALARQDGGKPDLTGERYRVRDACRAAEERYALRHATLALSGTPRDIAARDYPVSAADATRAGSPAAGSQLQQAHDSQRAARPCPGDQAATVTNRRNAQP
jgi:hypothetical protein